MQSAVLVIEDHKETSAMLKAALEESGYIVFCECTLQAGKEFLRKHKPCLIILDLNLPDGNGLEVCSWVRISPRLANTPIIALTGKDEFHQKKSGFSAGVDQYLTKPIEMDELVMWVEALLRRVDLDRSAGAVLTVGELYLDAGAQIVKYKNRSIENLTRREFDLLYSLVKISPGILSRQDILARVWKTVSVGNLVDTHLFNLKQKLPEDLARRIQAVAGKGFRYSDK